MLWPSNRDFVVDTNGPGARAASGVALREWGKRGAALTVIPCLPLGPSGASMLSGFILLLMIAALISAISLLPVIIIGALEE